MRFVDISLVTILVISLGACSSGSTGEQLSDTTNSDTKEEEQDSKEPTGPFPECDFPTPCEVFKTGFEARGGGGVSGMGSAADCIFEFLAQEQHSAAHLTFYLDNQDSYTSWHLYTGYAERKVVLVNKGYSQPRHFEQPPELCTLPEPAFHNTCLNRQQEPSFDCQNPLKWLKDCQPFTSGLCPPKAKNPPVELPKCDEPIEGLSRSEAKEKYWSCSLDSPCNPAVLRAMDEGGELKWDDPEAAACVINAFKAGEPASLKLEKNVGGGQYSNKTHLTILGPGKAVALYFNTQDDAYDVGILRRQIIKDAAYFDECAAATSDEAMYVCLADWSDGCHDEADVCPQ